MNKRKIINDPVYGFVTVPNDLIFDIIQHTYFQRLRRIKQLGLTDFVYPGALHTRFHHALGAMHLMDRALNVLTEKGHMIFDAEREAALIAILLHDIGHGPFSHTLEFSLFENVKHEQISSWAINRLNQQFNGRLELAIQIFEGRYHRKFLTQLVSSQLDADRLDYLQRDCFFTGVHEGTIGAERIIKMLNVVDENLVVEEKAIYSIENFLSARRLMYWQVYLHKTAISSERMLIETIRRAKTLTQEGEEVQATPALNFFLERNISAASFKEDPDLLEVFMTLDDTDIWGSLKFWVEHDDLILSKLSAMLLRRELFQVQLYNEAPKAEQVKHLRNHVSEALGISQKEAKYFVAKGAVSNAAYIAQGQSINILTKSGEVLDVAKATDLPNIKAMSKIVRKNYLCWPKSISLPD
ncbi:MAG: HD domain-containing protein [Cyclobacteriaceae bacterium]|nr:HD domain-containing protein [Cyclobacteriaceae bacterium HetDA_MAG_MS6]